MTPNETVTYELKPDQLAWLEAMATKHALPDVSKALRCVLNHAMQEPGAEAAIFGCVRCSHC
ncbi:MAG: hypothetical protein KDA25_00315 [Phycisphaerales bacterium]|nr:hypothetical protein [Phycisphaerales bacterium]